MWHKNGRSVLSRQIIHTSWCACVGGSGAQPVLLICTALYMLLIISCSTVNSVCSARMTHMSTCQELQWHLRLSSWLWMIQSILSTSSLWSTICTLLWGHMAGPCSSWRTVALEFVSCALGSGNTYRYCLSLGMFSYTFYFICDLFNMLSVVQTT
jgi:hypothetical protein